MLVSPPPDCFGLWQDVTHQIQALQGGTSQHKTELKQGVALNDSGKRTVMTV